MTWWTSTVDHYAKAYIANSSPVLALSEHLELRFLNGVLYRRNVSLRRLLNHWQLGRAFRRTTGGATDVPDLLLCSLPTIELAYEAVRYGHTRGVPVVLDVRDLWPDVLLSALPRRLTAVGRMALAPLYRRARAALGGCRSIIGISQGYLDWALRMAGRPRQPADRVFPIGYSRPTGGAPDGPHVKALRAAGVDPSRCIFWFIGSFGRTYDLSPIIDAARKLHEEGRSQAQFVFSGSGERDALWRRAAADVPNVVFTGWLTAPEIAWMLRMSYAGLAGYATGAPQGLPNKFFEYLSGDLPIVSGLSGEGAAVLAEHQCGITYDPAHPSTALLAIRRLLDDLPQRNRMAANARLAFEKYYASEAINARMLAFLEELAGQAG